MQAHVSEILCSGWKAERMQRNWWFPKRSWFAKIRAEEGKAKPRNNSMFSSWDGLLGSGEVTCRAALESEKRVFSQKGPLFQLFAGEPWGVAVQSTEWMYQVQAETS